ncbi:hypothetical protein OIV83_002686 [Microbotryomycetes sp. JL201]|nr:hypothetical protein OIV83_002686 [Microbotryomycetes sp. JL201]
MTPRRRTPSKISPAVWLAAAAATSLAAAGVAWWMSTAATSSTADERDNDSERDMLPPKFVVQRLSAKFKLHLVVASPSGQSINSPYDDVQTFERKRLIAHETPTGVVHVTRFLGGTVVFINGHSVYGDDLSTEKEGNDDNSQAWEYLNVNKLVRDTRTFVKGTIIVQGSKETLALDDDVAFSVAVMGGWLDLCEQLGA